MEENGWRTGSKEKGMGKSPPTKENDRARQMLDNNNNNVDDQTKETNGYQTLSSNSPQCKPSRPQCAYHGPIRTGKSKQPKCNHNQRHTQMVE